MNFWHKLKKPSAIDLRARPIFVLAPMADVTDAAFRRVIAKYGKPDAMFTEFVSADGLARAPEEGRKKLLKDLEYSESERPIVAQFFTSHPVYMKEAAYLARELGFDGVDINMGCPDKGVERQGAGAQLIKTPALARELIRAAKEGSGGLPVSVKTRVGFNKVELETWLPELLAEEPAVITIHARTRKEMSNVPAQWSLVKRAVEIRDEFALRQAQDKNKQTLIFGNGDIKNLEEAREKIKETSADGVMLGRAIFGNPWLFESLHHAPHPNPLLDQGEGAERRVRSIREKLLVLVEHTKLFEKLLGGVKNFAIMKKHYKAYVNGFSASPAGGDGAGELRAKLMETHTAKEVERIVEDFLKTQK